MTITKALTYNHLTNAFKNFHQVMTIR